MNTCQREGCQAEPQGVVGIEFYASKALMAYYHAKGPVTRMLVGLEVCSEHAKDIVCTDFFGDNFKNMISMVEHSTGVVIDPDACRAVLVAYDDPEYLMLRSMK